MNSYQRLKQKFIDLEKVNQSLRGDIYKLIKEPNDVLTDYIKLTYEIDYCFQEQLIKGEGTETTLTGIL
jgi:hypothetical protein